MKQRIIASILIFMFAFTAFSQVKKNSDTINKTDAKGKKQGYWIKYSGDTLKYEGFFKDDKPTGTFKYYYETGNLSSLMEYSKNGTFAKTIIYYPNGKKMAEGYYLNKKKDSIWLYYSQKDTLISEEHYKNTKRNGTWKTFYKNGKLNETREWVAGSREGNWKLYYSDGVSVKMEAKYSQNKIHGLFKFYYPSGKVFLSGMYHKGLKEGVWMQFDEKMQASVRETYKEGNLVKREELIKQPVEKMVPIKVE